MTELVARHSRTAGVTMRGVLENATWPLRKLVWMLEEKLLWPIADAFRSWTGHSFAHTRVEAVPEIAVEPAPVQIDASAPIDAGAQKVKRPLMPRTRARIRARLGRPGRDMVIVLGTVGFAAVVGIGIAKVAGGPTVKATNGPAQVGVATPGTPGPPPTSAATQTPASQASGLDGVAPNFKADSKSTNPSSTAATTQTSPTQGTNSKPSAIPPGVANDVAALHTAQDFAGAFVLYEVGKSSRQVKQTFARTATPALAKALKDRPPRLPKSVKVPTAKVQNVVLGTKTGKQIDASVSLLRLGDLSELRLTLIDHKGNWLVSEVRG